MDDTTVSPSSTFLSMTTPSTGETIVQYSRFAFACETSASLCSTDAFALLRDALALSTAAFALSSASTALSRSETGDIPFATR